MHTHQLLDKALEGDKASLSALLSSVEKPINTLCLRMLIEPSLAEDASQEIMIKLITKLASFKKEAEFSTWAYRVAINHLLNEKQKVAPPTLDFDDFKTDLESDLHAPAAEYTERPDYHRMLNELRTACSMALLLCLNSAQRLAYILGDILELDHKQASQALEISPANFRKRLSRARDAITAFSQSNCGLINRHAACRCDRKLAGAICRKRLIPGIYPLANQQQSYEAIQQRLATTKQELKVITLQQAASPEGLLQGFSEVLSEIIEQQLPA